MSSETAAHAISYSARFVSLWSDQLPPFNYAAVLSHEEGSPVSNLVATFEAGMDLQGEPSIREWLAVVESAFDFWDNPLDAAYDAL